MIQPDWAAFDDDGRLIALGGKCIAKDFKVATERR